MVLALVLKILTASFAQLALWDGSDYLLLGHLYLILMSMSLLQKQLQLSPLFICIFMTLKPSPSMCVLVVLVFFSPFLPLLLLLYSNSVFQ